MAAHDAMVELSGVLNVVAGSLMKIANDVRLLGSGPRNGIGELILPSDIGGSSIMPGKVNPTQAEAMSMVAAAVMGNHVAVTVANSHGHLDLQAFKPIIIDKVLDSIDLLAGTARSFATRCVDLMEPNQPRIQANLETNLMLVTALNPVIGYELGAKVAKKALAEDLTLRAAALALGVDAQVFDATVVPSELTRPNMPVPGKAEL